MHDVQAVALVLQELHGYTTRVLADAQATLPALRQLLQALPGEVGPDDFLVLYFAGHGVAESALAEDGKRAGAAQAGGFLIPQDATADNPDTFLPMAELHARISALPCRHLLLCLDCCFAGAFRYSTTRDMRVRRKTIYRERYERYLRDPARQVIASAAADERALDVVVGKVLGQRETGAPHSPFATALCAALGGDADLRITGARGDGVIVASELHFYVEEVLKRLEERTGQPQQKPLLWSLPGYDKGEFVFHAPGRALNLPSALELNEKNNPYRGLSPFSEDSSALFFGRGAVVSDLLAQVLHQPLTVVIGASGTGKTSLVCAGLLPRLRKHTEPAFLLLPTLRPGNQPLLALAAASAALGSKEAPLFDAVAAFAQAHPQTRVLLVIDQLEELVTLTDSAAERQQFLDQVARALGRPELRVVMTLRADFEPHFTATAGTPGARFLIRPMGREELREAVELPAGERVLYFDPPELIDRLVDEVVEMPGALPLLSFTLSELYRAYLRSSRDDRSLTTADYQALGEVAGALSRRMDEIYAGLDAAHQATLQRVMVRMVALEAGEVARRRVPRAELQYEAGNPEAARIEEVLRQLLVARLVVAGQDASGEAYVEPAHDKLVLGWQKLWTFIKQDQDSLPLLRRLTQATGEWEKGGRAKAQLWSADPRLPQLVALLRKQPERYNAAERAFVRISERRRRRQQVFGISVVAMTLAILSGLTLYAFSAQRNEKRQRELADQRLDAAVDTTEKILDMIDDKLGTIAGAAPVRRQLLDACGGLLGTLLENAAGHRAVLRTQATRLQHEAGLLLKNGGPEQIDGAIKKFDQALTISRQLAQADPQSSDYQSDLLASHYQLANALIRAGRAKQGQQHLEQARLVGEQLLKNSPAQGRNRPYLARTYSELGGLLVLSGSVEEAILRYRQALALMKTFAETAQAGPEAQTEEGQAPQVMLAVALIELGTALLLTNNNAESIEQLEQAQRIMTQLTTAYPHRIDWAGLLAKAINSLGHAMDRTDKQQEARAYFQQSLEIYERILKADPSDNFIAESLIGSYQGLFSIAVRQQRIDEVALLAARRMAVIAPRAAADPHNLEWQDKLATAQFDQGTAATLAGKLDAGRKHYEQALSILENHLGTQASNDLWQHSLQHCYEKLGKLEEKAERLDAARQRYEQALSILEQRTAHKPQGPKVQEPLREIHMSLGFIYMSLRKPEEAHRHFEQARTNGEALLAREPTNIHQQKRLWAILRALGLIETQSQKYDDARRHFEQDLVLAQKISAAQPNDSNQNLVAQAFGEIAMVMEKTGDDSGALARYEQKLAIEERLARTRPNDAELLDKLRSSHETCAKLAGKLGNTASQRKHQMALSKLQK